MKKKFINLKTRKYKINNFKSIKLWKKSDVFQMKFNTITNSKTKLNDNFLKYIDQFINKNKINSNSTQEKLKKDESIIKKNISIHSKTHITNRLSKFFLKNKKNLNYKFNTKLSNIKYNREFNLEIIEKCNNILKKQPKTDRKFNNKIDKIVENNKIKLKKYFKNKYKD